MKSQDTKGIHLTNSLAIANPFEEAHTHKSSSVSLVSPEFPIHHDMESDIQNENQWQGLLCFAL